MKPKSPREALNDRAPARQGSLNDVYCKYKKALEMWMSEENHRALIVDDFSKHGRKLIFAAITISMPVLIIILFFPIISVESNAALPVFIKILEWIWTNKIILVEIICLYLVCIIIMISKQFFNTNILSNKLHTLSSNLCPNFILAGNIIELSDEAIELYVRAFTFRRECLKQELHSDNHSDLGITLAVVISIIVNTLSKPEPIVFASAVILGALLLYFLKGNSSAERYELSVELSLCEMILKDLFDAKVIRANSHKAND